METLFRILSLQNKYFRLDDALTDLIDQTLANTKEEIDEEDLMLVQAARGSLALRYPGNTKEKGNK